MNINGTCTDNIGMLHSKYIFVHTSNLDHKNNRQIYATVWFARGTDNVSAFVWWPIKI